MSSFPTQGFTYALSVPNGTPDPADRLDGFASVLEPPIKLQPQQVYQPAAIFEPTPIIHGRQHIEPRPDLKLHPFVEPREIIHQRPQFVPGQTEHEPEQILPGKHYTERDTFEPRKVIHPAPRLQLEWTTMCCHCQTPSTIKPSPFVAPWELLPYPGSPAANGARNTVKLTPDVADTSRTGMMLDLFL